MDKWFILKEVEPQPSARVWGLKTDNEDVVFGYPTYADAAAALSDVQKVYIGIDLRIHNIEECGDSFFYIELQ